MASPQIIVEPLEVALLNMVEELMRATNVLEIGMFIGYRALCLAEALAVEGTVLMCELDEESVTPTSQYFEHHRPVTITRTLWGWCE